MALSYPHLADGVMSDVRGKNGLLRWRERPLTKQALTELFVRSVLFLCAIFSILMIFFIIYFLFIEGYQIFTTAGVWEFVTGPKWNPTGEPPAFGAWTLIVGTLLVTLGALLIAVPLGIAAAIFISELAPSRLKTWLKSAVELLAGIPSVVFGFFGLIVLTDWLRVTFDRPTGESWLAGSIILGIMALPTIVSVSEDAIGSVPREYKEGSYALGASRWQTIRNVVVPSAMSGITAAVILGMGRAMGETMAVMMVTGNSAILPSPITDVFSPVRTITGTLGIEMGEVARGSNHWHALFGLALILFIIVFMINTASTIISDRIKRMHIPTGKGNGKKIDCECKRPSMASVIVHKVKPWFRRALFVSLVVAIIWVLYMWWGPFLTFDLVILAIVAFLVSKRLSRNGIQVAAFSLLTAAMVAVLIMLGIIIYYIVSNGWQAMSWEFVSQPPRDLGRDGGIFPAIVGTLYLVAGAIIIALPIGICAAIYLTEYTREGKLTKIIRAGIDNLNGTPSIVFGLFGFAFLVLYLDMGISLIAGQITLALMILPTIIRTTEEALRCVPQSVREGSLALGATKWQTIRKVVLPPASPGIITGVILSIGRAAGETAPIMFTAVAFSRRFLPTSLDEPVLALPYHLFALTTSVPGSEQNAAGTALVLLILVGAIYFVAIMMRNHFKKKMKW